MFCELLKDEFWEEFQNEEFVKLYKVFDQDYDISCDYVDVFVRDNALREFVGLDFEKELNNGFAAYMTYSLETAKETAEKLKSPLIVCYVLKDKYKDFIILDSNLKSENANVSPKEMIISLVEPYQLQMIDKYVRNCKDIQPESRQLGLDFFSSIISDGGIQAKVLYDALSPSKPEKRLGWFYEKELLKTKIRGYVFGGSNNCSVVVRDFGSIMPVEYSTDCGKTWSTNDALMNTEGYKKIMGKSVYPPFEYGRYYNDMHIYSVEGVSRVKGDYGYNYMGASSHRHFFPVDVDYPLDILFFKFFLKIDFQINDYLFSLRKNEKYELFFIDEYSVEEQVSYTSFVTFIKEYNSNKPFYMDNILKELLQFGF